jgi:hypothetical protein
MNLESFEPPVQLKFILFESHTYICNTNRKRKDIFSFWPLGDNTWLCRTFALVNSVSVFVSTLSITAIAIDR